MSRTPNSARRESWATRWARRRFNFFPAFRGTGARITFLASDWREVHVKLPLNWRTRNYVGTTFGGSMYGAVDPFFMIMLIKALGPDYVVWDLAARIEFKKPGRTTLYAPFRLDDPEVAAVRRLAARGKPIHRTYRVALVDARGVEHAVVEKVIYVRLRRPEDGPRA